MVTQQELQQLQEQANQQVPLRRFGSRVTPKTQEQVIENKAKAQQILEDINKEEGQSQQQKSLTPQEAFKLAKKLNRSGIVAGQVKDPQVKYYLREIRQGQESAIEESIRGVEEQRGQSLTPELRERIREQLTQAVEGKISSSQLNQRVQNILNNKPVEAEPIASKVGGGVIYSDEVNKVKVENPIEKLKKPIQPFKDINNEPSVSTRRSDGMGSNDNGGRNNRKVSISDAIKGTPERIKALGQRAKEIGKVLYLSAYNKFDPSGLRRELLFEQNQQRIKVFNEKYGGRELSPEEYQAATIEEAQINNASSEIELLDTIRASQDESLINQYVLRNERFNIVNLATEVTKFPERLTTRLFEFTKGIGVTPNTLVPVVHSTIGGTVYVKAQTLVRVGLEVGQFAVPGYNEVVLGAYGIKGTSTLASPKSSFPEKIQGVLEVSPYVYRTGKFAVSKGLDYINEPLVVSKQTIEPSFKSIDVQVPIKAGERELATASQTNIFGVSKYEITEFTTRANEIKRYSFNKLFLDMTPLVEESNLGLSEGIPATYKEGRYFYNSKNKIATGDYLFPTKKVITKAPSISLTQSEIQISKNGKIIGTITKEAYVKRQPLTKTISSFIKDLETLDIKNRPTVVGSLEGGVRQSINPSKVPKVYKDLVGELSSRTNIKGKDIEVGEVVTKDLAKLYQNELKLIKPGKRTSTETFAGVTEEILIDEQRGITDYKQITSFETNLPSGRVSRQKIILTSEVISKDFDISEYLPKEVNYIDKPSRESVKASKELKQQLLKQNDIKELEILRGQATSQAIRNTKPTQVSGKDIAKQLGLKETQAKKYPTMVGGSAIGLSEYYGKGSYSEEQIILTKPNIKLNYKELSIESTTSVTQYKSFEISKELSKNLQREVPRVINRTPQRELEITRQGQRSLTRQLQRNVPRQTERPVERITPKTLKSSVPKNTIQIKVKLPKLKEGNKYYNLEEGYKTYEFVKGEKVYLPGVRTKAQALQVGEAEALQKLVATFGIERTNTRVKAKPTQFKVNLNQFRNYRIRGGKRLQLQNEFIQRRGKRLSSLSERSLIQQARGLIA